VGLVDIDGTCVSWPGCGWILSERPVSIGSSFMHNGEVVQEGD